MKLTVVIGKSESGDDYGPWVFDRKPSRRELLYFLQAACPGEFPADENETGPGDWGSYLHVSIHQVEISKI